jgi:hypothetical protein
VGLVRTDVSEKIASIFRVEKISQRRKAGNVSVSDFFNLMMGATHSSETSVHARLTRHHISEDIILHNHRNENFKSYIGEGWSVQRELNGQGMYRE